MKLARTPSNRLAGEIRADSAPVPAKMPQPQPPTRDMCAMKSAAWFFFALAFALAAPVQAARLDSAFRTGDFPRAVKSVGPAAERGEARAQAYLGFMYQYGHGVPQNYTLAYYWYRRGAEQGNATAQHLLGLLYDKG